MRLWQDVFSGLGVLALVVTLSVVFVPAPSPANAANAADFSAGNIISDQKFFDANAMSEGEIQSFFQGMGCTPRNGVPCLQDFRADTRSMSAGEAGHCSAYAGASGESAARILWKVSQACGISPKVLLVLMQKEQSLVTNPSSYGYERAMGWGCPDSGPNWSANCDANYFGYQNQVYKSAWQFRQYTLYPNAIPGGGTRGFQIGTYNIQYSPNPACGSSPVNIQNQATANLYLYTPYQPNQAALNNLYGTGDGCSSYGNRNFWWLYSDWFGSPTNDPYSSLDSVAGAYPGIAVSGWAIDPASVGAAYIWVNVNGSGQAYRADKPRAWFNNVFPGYGPNHGFDVTIPKPPGTYQVCVHNSSAGTLIACTSVTVPIGAASYDSITQTAGGLLVSGWAVDFRSVANPAPVTVKVNGQVSNHNADVSIPWINTYFPGVGDKHGFAVKIAKPPGTYSVCVDSVTGSLGCKSVTVQRIEHGSFDSVTGVSGGLQIKGWAYDTSTSNPSYIWVNVNGSGQAYRADKKLTWFEGLFPGAGLNHGFDVTIPFNPGTHSVCVFTSATSKSLGCKTVTVPGSSPRVEHGSFDGATGVAGGIKITGWAYDTSTSNPSYIWADVDGSGQGYKANKPLTWFEGLFPGAGLNHGFDVTVPASPGAHTICVYTSVTSKKLGCKTVTVPGNTPRVEYGSFDTITGLPGAIKITGWAYDTSTSNPS